MISSKENDMKEEIYQGYQQLAFGSIADAIKLLFMEEPAPRALRKNEFYQRGGNPKNEGGGHGNQIL